MFWIGMRDLQRLLWNYSFTLFHSIWWFINHKNIFTKKVHGYEYDYVIVISYKTHSMYIKYQRRAFLAFKNELS